MSGRFHPDDIIASLYAVVDDTHLVWLDQLLIDAGLRRRCPCGDITAADEACQRCGGTDEDYFAIYRCEPEATYTTRGGRPRIEIRIAAAGGGTLGHAYAHNDWIYAVDVDGQRWHSGTDLRSGAVAATHAQMAGVLADRLSRAPGTPGPLADGLAQLLAPGDRPR